MSDAYCVILTTAGNQDEADKLANLLGSRKLAACVQIANIASCYMWKGNVCRESEYLLLIKTAAHLYPEVEEVIVENHSYEIPEVIQLPIAQGLDRYLEWVGLNTK
jgi:periplasmic divalent cation tolerance protein